MKCNFGQTEVKFLGYLVTPRGIQPLPTRVQALQDFPLPKTAKELRRFLGMINFYRRFIPEAAKKQAPIHNLLGAKKGATAINWTDEARQAFENTKQSLTQTTLLAHPRANAKLALFTDASDHSIGAVLQQQHQDGWEPLAFFSKKLSPTEAKYSAFDRELLAIYLAIKHFCHMVEARRFVIYTDHKPITFAFRQKPEKCTPRQFRYLDFIGQFSTDIRHIAGSENITADTLSRIETINSVMGYEALARSQQDDPELKTYINQEKGLQLTPVKIPGSEQSIWCDVTTGNSRPFLTPPFRRVAFDIIHNLAHPGIKTTTRLVAQRYVWPSMNKECREWARACEKCQQSKVTRHTSAPLGKYNLPTKRFEHVHLDIIILPISEGYRYCLTCIDRYTRWPEVFPMENQEAETVARTFYTGWIARFGVPLRITTDQGRQFESQLFKQLNRLTGSQHLHTTAYHPQANGLVERFHRHLKAALRCHSNNRWTEALPTIMLGIRAAWREDLGATTAELVYGETLRLPGQFLDDQPTTAEDNATHLISTLRNLFNRLRPISGTNHDAKQPFIFKDLSTASHVFVRHDGPRSILQPPYDKPFPVIKRTNKTVRVQIQGRNIDISIDRIKPAYLLADSEKNALETSTQNPEKTDNPEKPPTRITRAGRHVRFPDYFKTTP